MCLGLPGPKPGSVPAVPRLSIPDESQLDSVPTPALFGDVNPGTQSWVHRGTPEHHVSFVFKIGPQYWTDAQPYDCQGSNLRSRIEDEARLCDFGGEGTTPLDLSLRFLANQPRQDTVAPGAETGGSRAGSRVWKWGPNPLVAIPYVKTTKLKIKSLLQSSVVRMSEAMGE